ncbi:unnamed protein product [Prunus brigantina]
MHLFVVTKVVLPCHFFSFKSLMHCFLSFLILISFHYFQINKKGQTCSTILLLCDSHKSCIDR